MRDVRRIRKFCSQLEEIWEEECPDWRFGQFVENVFGAIPSSRLFYMEEEELMETVKNYFGRQEQ